MLATVGCDREAKGVGAETDGTSLLVEGGEPTDNVGKIGVTVGTAAPGTAAIAGGSVGTTPTPGTTAGTAGTAGKAVPSVPKKAGAAVGGLLTDTCVAGAAKMGAATAGFCCTSVEGPAALAKVAALKAAARLSMYACAPDTVTFSMLSITFCDSASWSGSLRNTDPALCRRLQI